jgi:hypothetical protein
MSNATTEEKLDHAMTELAIAKEYIKLVTEVNRIEYTKRVLAEEQLALLMERTDG